MKTGRSLVNLAKELERQLATKKDMVVPPSLMAYSTTDHGVSSLEINEQAGVQAYGITTQLTNSDAVVAAASSLVDTGTRFVCPLIRE